LSKKPLDPDARRGPVAGPRFTALSVVTLGFVGLFLLIVLALIIADLLYTDAASFAKTASSPEIRAAMRLSLFTSGVTLAFVLLFAVPIGYALSRYRLPCHAIVDTIVDLPIVLPPIVIGVSVLVFFRPAVREVFQAVGLDFVHSVKGIILCQFLVSASYGIRAAAAAFDGVDRRLEHLALTLGCAPGRAFRLVALPMARNGIVAGAIMAWARAVGVFGPLMIVAGSVRMKTEVLPTTIYLELTIGGLKVALAVALVMLAMATVALILIHAVAPGRRWWGV